MASRYERGDHALFRYVWPEKVFWALPVTVVEDSEDRTILWVAPGSPFMRPPTLRVPIPRVAARRWTLAETTWFGGGVLMIGEKGVPHAIWVIWDERAEFNGWYVNLEEPRRRTRLGFDTTDHVLDIVVQPDRSWQWKDEDELVEAVQVGLHTREKGQAIREEGERVLERIEAWRAPFNEGWENWRPDPDWQLPSIPDGWDRISA